MRRLGLLLLIGITNFLLACAPTVPRGALFKPMSPPGANDTLVYVYRQDSLRGIDGVQVELDGEKLGRLLNGEYLAFLLDPGSHEIRARMDWFQIIPRSWNALGFTSQPGQTLYIRVWAAYEQAPTPNPGLNTKGPSSDGAKVGLFLALEKPEVAREEIKSTRSNPNH